MDYYFNSNVWEAQGHVDRDQAKHKWNTAEAADSSATDRQENKNSRPCSSILSLEAAIFRPF